MITVFSAGASLASKNIPLKKNCAKNYSFQNGVDNNALSRNRLT